MRPNNWKLLREWLDHGFPEDSPIRAVKRDDVQQFQIIVSAPGFDVNQPIDRSFLEAEWWTQSEPTLIEYTAFFGAARCFKYLMHHGVDVRYGVNKSLCDTRRQPLDQLAIAGGNHEIITILSQLGWQFQQCLPIAVQHFRHDYFTWIRRCKPPEPGKSPFPTVFHWAVVSGNLRMMIFCMDQKTLDVNWKDTVGAAPLHAAILYARFEAVRLLLLHPHINPNQAAVNPLALGQPLETPLQIAAGRGLAFVVGQLLQHKAIDVNLKSTRDGLTPLHRACRGNHTETVRLLLTHPKIDLRVHDIQSVCFVLFVQLHFTLPLEWGILKSSHYSSHIPGIQRR
jgi:hypothetical protein